MEIERQEVELSKQKVDKVNAFLKSFESAGGHINQNKNHQTSFSGRLEKNGISYSFEIGSTGYISQDIKVYYMVKDTIENFKKLSNNQYK